MSRLSESNFSFPKEISICVSTGWTCHLRGSQTRLSIKCCHLGSMVCVNTKTRFTPQWHIGVESGGPFPVFADVDFLRDFLQIETSGYACRSSQAAGSEDKSETGLLLWLPWDVG